MARIVKTTYKPIYGFKIVNFLASGKKEENTFFVDDEIEGLQYVENNEVKSVSGRVSDVDIHFRRSSVVTTNAGANTFTEDAGIISVSIDHSTENNADITVVPAMEILDFNATDDVVRVQVLPAVKVKLVIDLSDGMQSDVTLEEYKEYKDVVLALYGREVTKTFTLASFAYTAMKAKEDAIYGVIFFDGEIADDYRFDQIKEIEDNVNTEQPADGGSETGTETGSETPDENPEDDPNSNPSTPIDNGDEDVDDNL